MKFATVKNKVHDIPKGAFTSVLWEREAKTKAGCFDIIKKRVRATVRVGIKTWDEYPYFITHTPKNGDETKYLRAYIGKGSNMTTEWYLNGRKVDVEVVRPMLLASELKAEEITEEKPIVVKVNDILSIG